jgi:sugar/nucleoside kinase (ribokinase family)
LVDIVVLGHILNEKIVFPDREIYPVLGSPVAYSSVCMASLDVKIGIVTKVGKNFPQNLLHVFDELMVNKDGLKVGRNSTCNKLIYDNNGNKTLKYLSKAEDIFFRDIPDSYHNAKIFYVCPMDYEIHSDTIKKISVLKKIIAIDLGGYGGGTSDTHPEEKDGHEIKGLCSYCHVVKASIEDFSHIFGVNADEKKISKKVIDWGAKVCVITLGEKGSFVKTHDKEKYIPPYPIKRIVDQTGAGDCYSAGFLVHFLEDEDPYISAQYATATTSYIIERTGGVISKRMPNKDEVERRVQVIKDLVR